MSNEVSVRIQRMAAAYSRLAGKLFENKRIKLKTKLRAFDTFIMSNGLYGAATWSLKEDQFAQFDQWQYRHLRKILGYTWRDFKSYDVMLQETAQCGVVMYPMHVRIRMIQLKYLGHVLRMPSFRLPKLVMHGDAVAVAVFSCMNNQELKYQIRNLKGLID